MAVALFGKPRTAHICEVDDWFPNENIIQCEWVYFLLLQPDVLFKLVFKEV
jgi:hypothetical protein